MTFLPSLVTCTAGTCCISACVFRAGIVDCVSTCSCCVGDIVCVSVYVGVRVSVSAGVIVGACMSALVNDCAFAWVNGCVSACVNIFDVGWLFCRCPHVPLSFSVPINFVLGACCVIGYWVCVLSVSSRCAGYMYLVWELCFCAEHTGLVCWVNALGLVIVLVR